MPRKTAAKPKAKTAAPVRREVGALVCFLLSIFGFLSLSGVKALFIDLVGHLCRRVLGVGFYVLPPALLLAALLLLFHRGKPVRLRIWCALLTPLLISAALHLWAFSKEYEWSFSLFGQLWQDGGAMQGGGLLGGLLAMLFETIFSAAGASILFVIGFVTLVMVIARMSPVRLVDALINRERPAYEVTDRPKPAETRTRAPRMPPVSRPAKGKLIDVPLDDHPPLPDHLDEPVPESEPVLPARPAHIRTPAELLGAKPEEKSAPPPVMEAQLPVIRPEPEPSRPMPPEPAGTILVAPEPAGAGDKRTGPGGGEAAKPAGQAGAYQYPPLMLLGSARPGSQVDGSEELKANAALLAETIQSFGIDAHIINITRGPSVARYELELDRGVKLSRLTGLSEDIALSLGTSGVRIAPVPDKQSVVGIEVPNKLVSTVYIRDVLESAAFSGKESKLAFAIGKDIGGQSIVGDIAKLTHLLIAGTTGSGKSVCMNSLIISLLYKASPDEVKLIMIDPKMVELGIYNGIPHLQAPVVTDPKRASSALQWAVTEMERRYRLFMETGVRDLFSYNQAVRDNPQEAQTPILPQIVIVIDELADLMMVAAKEVEESICRIAQKARAAGMHLVIATQRPSADVITGLMKANIPSRIAFAVASALESRIILDTQGADKLVGRGDMLYCPLGQPKPLRVQGCLISGSEVERVVTFIKRNSQPNYSEEIMEFMEKQAAQKEKGEAPGDYEDDEPVDTLFAAAIDMAIEMGQVSTSMLQRRLKLGYARAGRLMDQLEERGFIGPPDGAKPRQIKITREQWQEMQARGDH